MINLTDKELTALKENCSVNRNLDLSCNSEFACLECQRLVLARLGRLESELPIEMINISAARESTCERIDIALDDKLKEF